MTKPTTRTTTPQPNSIEPGQMRFLDNYLPLLAAGHYNVSVTQTLKASTSDDPLKVNVAQTATQEFYVDGPRLAISPQDIYHQFPPSNAQGVFETALPQIVLGHRGLPWERSIWDNAPEVPWMALVVLDADEIMPPDTGSAVGAQVPGTGATTISASEIFGSAPSGVLLPDITPTSYQDMSEQVQVVDLTPDGFNTAVPTQDVLSWLGSVREVDVVHKVADRLLDGQSRSDFGVPNWSRWFSVLTAARFPLAPATRDDIQTQVVHLVSLEGFTDYLRSDNPAPLPAGTERVRMVSLASWSFASLPQTGQDFAQLMQGLAPEDGETLAFALPQQTPGSDITQSAADVASTALSAGYVPRSYQTRQGEATFAWYRGPFVPTIPAPLPTLEESPLTSAELAVYDPDTGLFDMSYATAFETGRMLALGNGSFTQALMRWQARGLRLVSLLAERSQDNRIDLAATTPEAIAALIAPEKTTRRVVSGLAGGGLDRLNATFLNPQTNAAPTPQSASHSGDLGPEDIAETLAIDPVRVWLRQWARNLSGPIKTFLSRLWLLEQVPYNTLVPDHALLPMESFRAFYLDRNWQLALIQGALSIGVTGSREHAFQKVLRGALLEIIETEALNRRGVLLDWLGVDAEPGLQMSGCLLRSAAVSGWPGLEIKAFHGGATTPVAADQRDINTARTVPLPTARLDRLGPQVMLGLFRGLADWMEIDEPREGLHFGVQPSSDDPPLNNVYLRYLDGDQVGQEIGPDSFVTVSIDPTTRVLDVPGTAAALQTALDASSFGPGDFALQMIQVPESMVFTTSTGSTGTTTSPGNGTQGDGT